MTDRKIHAKPPKLIKTYYKGYKEGILVEGKLLLHARACVRTKRSARGYKKRVSKTCNRVTVTEISHSLLMDTPKTESPPSTEVGVMIFPQFYISLVITFPCYISGMKLQVDVPLHLIRYCYKRTGW